MRGFRPRRKVPCREDSNGRTRVVLSWPFQPDALIPERRLAPEAAMIICHCKVVTTRCVTRALDAGASTTAQVCRHTKAGGDCGACVLTIKSLVLQHRSMDQPDLDPVRSGGVGAGGRGWLARR